MQIKTTMYHSALTKMVIIKNIESKSIGEDIDNLDIESGNIQWW